jgi:hypothetical protein
MLNYGEACDPGNGLCKNLARYSKISVAKRKEHNSNLFANNNGDPNTNQNNSDDESDSMSICSEDPEDDANLNLDSLPHRQKGPPRKLHWKTEYLIYCFYVKCNISQKRCAALFGVGCTLVHDIVYSWANLLCDALEQIFPVPTRSQLLRAYPKSVLKKFGHTQIFMLLDATKGYAQVSSMKTVNAILYSAYKHHSTMKWLVGCDPIGAVWNSAISDGFGGSISDPMLTCVTNILEQIPFGSSVEVDKGFLIENLCALLGVHCVRQMKMLDKQTQQSKEDVALTQKVGKTRIPIEQANGQMKCGTSFFDKAIRIQQLGLADLIFCSSYLLTNFKLGFIQDRDENVQSEFGRPCKAEIRWYGGMDDGLDDFRPLVMFGGRIQR